MNSKRRKAMGRMQSVQEAIVGLGLRRPKMVILGVLLITLVLGALIIRVETDTDPENMLPKDNPVRVLNQLMRDDFGTRDMIVLGIVDESGVLTRETLTATARLIDEIRMLDGVISEEVISFKSATDVPEVDLSQEDVDRIAGAVDENALFAGRVISPDEKGLAVYIPLESKDAASDVSSSIKALLKKDSGGDTTEYYLAGLPLAEEEFGRNMFLQMAYLAPLAGMLIFLLMFFFFRRLSLVVAAMAVTMLSVIWTMGLLIGAGYTVHIMSSMIPVFLMPIAILPSIHILSEFFDRYRHYQDRRETLRAVYKELFVPISYTSLTTAVAFAALALAPIPPVRVFGLFIALGVFVAWLLSLVFIPAFIMLLSEKSLKRSLAGDIEGSNRILTGGLRLMGRFASKRSLAIPAVFVLLMIAAVPGVAQISVNDNPVRWFKGGSEIREAAEVFNLHFPGSYNANLLLEADHPGMLADPAVATSVAALQDFWKGIDVVGQTTSYVDIVMTENYLSHGRDEASRAIPRDQAEIEQLLESVAASPSGGAVGSFITSDYRKSNVQIQMKNGDNKAMKLVVDRTEAYLEDLPLPAGIRTAWAGETYLNLVWQDEMVTGMLKAFLTTFGVVLLLMILLFRSLRWAILAMVPMSATILFVYGVVGYSGKDYDMPMAVLSTLVLGIAIDYAIHFIQRYRQLRKETPTTRAALDQIFEEPARALTRNALIIAIGFVPMFFASLVPYIVVGAFLTSIMLLSWLATLLLLPAVITFFQRKEGRTGVPPSS